MSKTQLINLCNDARIPSLFTFKEYENASQFKIKAEAALYKIQNGINLESELDDETIYNIIYACSLFIAEPLSNLNLENLKQSAKSIMNSLVTLQPKRFISVSHMIQIFTPMILEKFVKSVFMKHPDFKTKNKSLAKMDVDIELLRIEMYQASEKIMNNVISPVLMLIDDYNFKFKLRGVLLIDHLIKEISPAIIKRTGLGEVFYEALFKCLAHQLEPSDLVLLKPSFAAILNLITYTEPSGSESRYKKLDNIFNIFVVKGLTIKYDKIILRQFLLQQIPFFVDELGIMTVKHLNELLKEISSSLEVTLELPNIRFKDEILSLHISGAKAIEKIIVKCWPRIAHYKGLILKSIASSWCQVKHLEENDNPYKEKIELLKNTLHKSCQLLKYACMDDQIAFKRDVDALKKLDIKMFGDLLNDL
ncbi:9440_t:CDS:2 [Entrophospora sp. SA101]|nr:9440_t:CDS:2 [Entrophospora sp. SA101]